MVMVMVLNDGGGRDGCKYESGARSYVFCFRCDLRMNIHRTG